MTTPQIQILLVLFASLILFAWGRWRYDLVAMFSLLACILLGLVPEAEAFHGFGHPAVVTVIAVLILSQGLQNAGVVNRIAELFKRAQPSPTLLLASLTLIVTLLSAFMNNVGALALMLPVTMMAAEEYKIPPARLLMPLAFGSILGGLATLIGTPPNIIISGYRADTLGNGYSMFDFAPVGVPVALLGVAFIVLLGWRLIPQQRMSGDASFKLFQIESYLTEVRATENCNCVGERLSDLPLIAHDAIELLGIADANGFMRTIAEDHRVRAGDIFILRADPTEISPLIDKYGFELVTTATHIYEEPDQHSLMMLEGVLTRDSPLIGRDTRFLRRLSGRSIALVGLARKDRPMVPRLRRQIFRIGDVLLLQGHQETIDEQFKQLGLLPLATRPLRLDRPPRVAIALLSFGAAVVLAMTHLLTLPVAFTIAIIVYVFAGIIRVREIYSQVDWSIIILLGAMIPVGHALETTGATIRITELLIALAGGDSPVLILVLIMVITMLLSSLVNNAATALVMAPIGVAAAESMNVSPDPFLMAIAIGASCAFLTPIGHQSNTLVMAPGGYQFGDYWRMGLPLELLILVLSIPLILLVWPL
ncbi:MAG: SLC13 family permease [Gammaproteobacteria bacterium]|nr:SLC13 family permease [Gammaproteobacteria bacterium]